MSRIIPIFANFVTIVKFHKW